MSEASAGVACGGLAFFRDGKLPCPQQKKRKTARTSPQGRDRHSAPRKEAAQQARRGLHIPWMSDISGSGAAIVAEHPAVAAAWYVKNLTVNTRVFKFMRVRVLRI